MAFNLKTQKTHNHYTITSFQFELNSPNFVLKKDSLYVENR